MTDKFDTEKLIVLYDSARVHVGGLLAVAEYVANLNTNEERVIAYDELKPGMKVKTFETSGDVEISCTGVIHKKSSAGFWRTKSGRVLINFHENSTIHLLSEPERWSAELLDIGVRVLRGSGDWGTNDSSEFRKVLKDILDAMYDSGIASPMKTCGKCDEA